MTQLFAHSNSSTDLSTWQPLEEHLAHVADLAAEFAVPFNSSLHAELAGQLHDLGKARSAFQSYLRRCNGVEDEDSDIGDHTHAIAGAIWLWNRAGSFGKALAYCVAGHHAGLPDWSNGETPNGALAIRLKEDAPVVEEQSVHQWITSHEEFWLRNQLVKPLSFQRNDSSVSFWIRMLYSCLVDADFLDTEAFMSPTQHAARATSSFLPLSKLATLFFEKIEQIQTHAAATPVNAIRAEIRVACEKAADMPPGLFSLSVPTGGGKTLSSLAFAFRHALHHGLRRIIYVIPYTSITEQTANVLRNILGEGQVLEHHSNLEPDRETMQSRLASENWDAPVIVTTTVQFFESLYACRSSRCRKLHNMAESVVILDEVQLLPTRLLLPCTEALRQLVTHYNMTVLLSTATQMILPGLDASCEIIPSEANLYERLKRAEIELPEDFSLRREWEDIADELKRYEQVLCIVNTRSDCRRLFDLMPQGTLHLSALMCGAHRSKVIDEIKHRLKTGQPVRVISTQLVEAGVDFDFPVVYRAISGLASIVQAAGRCNREGRREHPGRVVVFMPPKAAPVGDLRKAEDITVELLSSDAIASDIDAPEAFSKYFDFFLGRCNDLGQNFGSMLGVPVPGKYCQGTSSSPTPFQYQFREAADAFRMIPDTGVPVIVNYGESVEEAIQRLRFAGPSREIMRRLQRHTVQVPPNLLKKLLERGFVEEIHLAMAPAAATGIYVQTLPSAYSDLYGLDIFREEVAIEDTIL